MLARHPDIAIKNRAVTRERGCASCERAGSWSVRVRWGRGCTECSAGVLRVGLWMSVDFFGRTCCRGPKIRLQLRSSLATSAKKVFGKQRLTSLVNVSFPAPGYELQAFIDACKYLKKGPFGPFFISVAGACAAHPGRRSTRDVRRFPSPGSPGGSEPRRCPALRRTVLVASLQFCRQVSIVTRASASAQKRRPTVMVP